MLTAQDYAGAIARLRGNRTQKSCAERAGVSRPTWCKWESGKVVPREENHQKIARGLQVELEELQREVVQACALRCGLDLKSNRPPARVQRIIIELEDAVFVRFDGIGESEVTIDGA